MKTPTHRIWMTVAAGLWTNTAMAGAGQTFLNVNITLTTNTPTVCITEALSKQTNAMVRVVCAANQFVSISPLPGKPFFGTYGGAFRYSFGLGKKFDSLANSSEVSTTTELPIFSTNSMDSPLEVLVSY